MLSVLAAAVLAAAAVGTAWFLDSRGVTPRALAPYVAKRSSGHNQAIEQSGKWMQRTLISLDRGSLYAGDDGLLQMRPGAQARAAPPLAVRALAVSSVAQLREAMAGAMPGDVITLAPGEYAIMRGELGARRPGAEGSPIVVRAERPGTAVIEMGITEGFKVTAPHWTFENLTIRGTCKYQLYCEHAFHVVGNADHFTARNNTIVDFNSHFKINGRRGDFPDHGAIIGNTITNTTIRDTGTAVTLVDLVSGSDWVIRGNVITDFIKGGGDRISYGVFAKGAGARNILEQNIVVCEHLLRGPGQRVGMSLGGGGTAKRYCRDRRCITEQDDSVIRANLIASCSDDGVYLNSAARSVVSHNTVLDTGGIVVRFAESSAEVEGNLVDGAIRSRDGGVVRAHDNFDTSIMALYAGSHAVRQLFTGSSVATLDWAGEPARREAPPAKPAPDLCGGRRPSLPAYGAFEALAGCRQ
ncbi:right-handed parallel beta-helix repeat-containing protein [Massilia sp. RP-1-19]|uniref:Right-handed parallel beta-helix repeat-containing protein n=2 Tax=Massilia polaris TaxID=2728846 RepID=A0A848HJB7_9BURK|nr:right-handed parallel beta-helix repeat-containing protein [Massilia polaris]